MAAQRYVNPMRYGVLVIQIIAMAALVWAFILGIQSAIGSSVVGGLAVMLIAALSLPFVGWRVKYCWTQLHGEGSNS